MKSLGLTVFICMFALSFFTGCQKDTDEMVFVQGGSFMVGSSAEGIYDALPIHQVNVGSFFIGKYEVTYQEWKNVRNWGIDHGYIFAHPGERGSNTTVTPTDYHPVIFISWYDAIAWCNAKSEKEGLPPCYFTDPSHSRIYRDSSSTVAINNECVDWNSGGYRLPTEAEWEFAARNRGIRPGEEFSGSSTINEVAWYDENSTNGTHPVGQKKPNELGIYDMSGNVFEWCWDYFAKYPSEPQQNPRGPDSADYRICRGGSWYFIADGHKPAYRHYDRPYMTEFWIGMRIAKGMGR